MVCGQIFFLFDVQGFRWAAAPVVLVVCEAEEEKEDDDEDEDAKEIHPDSLFYFFESKRFNQNFNSLIKEKKCKG